MKGPLSTEHVEDRVRSTMIRRAEDMAAGDGAAWDPTDTVRPLGRRALTEHPPRSRPLAAVVAVVVVIAGAAAGLGVANHDDPSRRADTTAGGDADRPRAEGPFEGEVPRSTTPPTVPGPDSGQILGTTLATYVRTTDGAVVEVRWFPPEALELPNPPGSEDLRAGGYRANYWEGSDQQVSSLALFFEDGILRINGDEVGMREDLLAFADGVRRIPGRTEPEVTPPPGYAPG